MDFVRSIRAFLVKAGIIMALILLVSTVAAAKRPHWKKDYNPKDSSEQELLKACAYGNVKACFTYHDRYIQKQGPATQ